MNHARIMEILSETAFPNSRSVYEALNKVWNEVAQERNPIAPRDKIHGQPLDLYLEVSFERLRQDAKWGGPAVDDRRKTAIDWLEDIEAYTAWAKQMHRMGSPDKYRRRMMQIAALAIAACESFDRPKGE